MEILHQEDYLNILGTGLGIVFFFPNLAPKKRGTK
jgi:hypothetical protein